MRIVFFEACFFGYVDFFFDFSVILVSTRFSLMLDKEFIMSLGYQQVLVVRSCLWKEMVNWFFSCFREPYH